MIPTPHADGHLPEGIHDATWAEFEARFGFSLRRALLLAGLKSVLRHLATAGCAFVYVGGSFVTTKRIPADVDLLWDIDSVDPDQLHPAFHGPDGIPAIKARFGVECFPTNLREEASGQTFVDFFQHNRDGKAVGIVRIDLTEEEFS